MTVFGTWLIIVILPSSIFEVTLNHVFLLPSNIVGLDGQPKSTQYQLTDFKEILSRVPKIPVTPARGVPALLSVFTAVKRSKDIIAFTPTRRVQRITFTHE